MAEDNDKYAIRLFVSGDTPHSRRAEANLVEICDENSDCVDVSVINVREQPDKAESYGILATPTLVKIAPPPAVRVIGDLSDHARVIELIGFELKPYQDGAVGG